MCYGELNTFIRYVNIMIIISSFHLSILRQCIFKEHYLFEIIVKSCNGKQIGFEIY